MSILDVYYQYPANQVIRHLPDASAFGRVEKYLFHPDRVDDLHWTLQRASRGQSICTGLMPEEEKKQKEDNAKPATIVVEGQIPKKATQFAPLDTPDPMVVPNSTTKEGTCSQSHH